MWTGRSGVGMWDVWSENGGKLMPVDLDFGEVGIYYNLLAGTLILWEDLRIYSLL